MRRFMAKRSAPKIERNRQGVGERMSTNIFKLNSASSGYPTIQSGALPRGYFSEFFNGAPLPDSWEPPPVEIKRAKARLPDIIAWKEYLPLLSKRAVDLFNEVAPGCAEYGKFVSIRGELYSVINVLATEDLLDLERSEVTRSIDGGIRSVTRYVFKADHVPRPVFKLSNLLDGPIFVTRGLAEATRNADLLGFQFRDPAVNETALLFSGADVNAFP